MSESPVIFYAGIYLPDHEMERFWSRFNNFRENGDHFCLLISSVILRQIMLGMHSFSPYNRQFYEVTKWKQARKMSIMIAICIG